MAGLLLLVGLLGAPLTPNPILSFSALAVLAVLVALLWRPGEPPVLLFVVAYQWFQISMQTFYANWLGVPVEAVSTASETVFYATSIALAGLFTLGIGIFLARGASTLRNSHMIAAKIEDISIYRIVTLILVFNVVTPVLMRFVPSGIYQILLHLLSVKWFLIFVLIYVAMATRKNAMLVCFVSLFELMYGSTGYFAGFKDILLIGMIAYATTWHMPRLGAWFLLGGGAWATITAASIWTAIKPEYRNFISDGYLDQAIRTTLFERLWKLLELIMNLDSNQMVTGIDGLANRLIYTDFVAEVMAHVPAIVPHEGGALWGAAFLHIAMPRLLFPGKPVVWDSELTMKYTGRVISDSTSISVGYMAHSYIDFGVVGMFIPIFLIGCCLGAIYRFFAVSNVNRWGAAYGQAAAVCVIYNAQSFGQGVIKLVGAMLTSFIAMTIWMYVAMPFVDRYLRSSTSYDLNLMTGKRNVASLRHAARSVGSSVLPPDPVGARSLRPPRVERRVRQEFHNRGRLRWDK